MNYPETPRIHLDPLLMRALKAERQLAERDEQIAEARTALEDIKGRCSDMSITLHPDADAKGCVDDCWEWSEQALARIAAKGTP